MTAEEEAKRLQAISITPETINKQLAESLPAIEQGLATVKESLGKVPTTNDTFYLKKAVKELADVVEVIAWHQKRFVYKA